MIVTVVYRQRRVGARASSRRKSVECDIVEYNFSVRLDESNHMGLTDNSLGIVIKVMTQSQIGGDVTLEIREGLLVRKCNWAGLAPRDAHTKFPRHCFCFMFSENLWGVSSGSVHV